jgi:hypothetical protein
MRNQDIPEVGEKYRHFKGEDYMVVGLDLDADYNDGRKRVRYINLQDKLNDEGNVKFPEGTNFSRSIEGFVGEKVFERDEIIDNKEYKKGDKIRRFTKI